MDGGVNGRSINQLNLEMQINLSGEQREKKKKKKKLLPPLYITRAQRETEMKAVTRTTGDQG
jgi:hypothetical protein